MYEDTRIFKVKNVTATHIYTGSCYSILRLNTKYHTSANGVISHMTKYILRKEIEDNVDKDKIKDNKLLIGTGEIKEDITDYLKDIKTIRKNSVVAREIILTATGEWFNNKKYTDIYKWSQQNKKFLIDTFGDNCRLAVLHMDEIVPHIHAIIIPKHYLTTYKCNSLSGARYWGGKGRLIEMQDKYAETIQEIFPELQRGIKGSMAKNESIRKMYTLLTEPLNEKDIEQVKVKARHTEVLETKLHFAEKTKLKLSKELERYKEGREIMLENLYILEKRLNSKEKEVNVFQRLVQLLKQKYKVQEKELEQSKRHCELLEQNNLKRTFNEHKLHQLITEMTLIEKHIETPKKQVVIKKNLDLETPKQAQDLSNDVQKNKMRELQKEMESIEKSYGKSL